MILKTQETPCRMATWWLTKSEAGDAEFNKSLRVSIREYQKAGYMTATFCSGRENLEENTRQLMSHNFELQSKANLAPVDGGEAFLLILVSLIYLIRATLIFLVAFSDSIRYNVAMNLCKRSEQH